MISAKRDRCENDEKVGEKNEVVITESKKSLRKILILILIFLEVFGGVDL